MPECKLDMPSDQSAVSLADWAEAIVVVEGKRRLSRASLRSRLRASYLDDSEIDVTLDLIMQEFKRRMRAAGDGYPFALDNTNLKRIRAGDSVYNFLVLVSASTEFRRLKEYDNADRLFDLLVLHALRTQFGPRSQGVRFAYPSSDGRPSGFLDALAWLRGKLGLREGPAYKQSTKKDAGVDVVVWRPFRDGQTGFVSVLAQCTVGLDWPDKARDIVLDLWMGYVDFGTHPLTTLAVPFVVPWP
jgi:hypothetical protein